MPDNILVNKYYVTDIYCR